MYCGIAHGTINNTLKIFFPGSFLFRISAKNNPIDTEKNKFRFGGDRAVIHRAATEFFRESLQRFGTHGFRAIEGDFPGAQVQLFDLLRFDFLDAQLVRE